MTEQELNQTGGIQEQPKEEISKEVSIPSTEDKATSKQRTEDEFRKIQSMKDKADARLQKVESELQELRKQREQERLLRREREIADLEGDSEAQSKVRKKHQLEDELSELQSRREREEGAVGRKYDQAMELASKYDLNLSEARELLEATTPREMELMAQLKAREKEKREKKEAFTPDSGASDAASTNFERLQQDFIKNPVKYGKAYREALAKRGK